jgi:hypothetical protein
VVTHAQHFEQRNGHRLRARAGKKLPRDEER